MKIDRRNNEIFSLSFLDIICCGFGAMVLLILLSKTDVVGGTLNIAAVKNLLNNITAEKKRSATNEKERSQLLVQAHELAAEISATASPNISLAALQQQLAERQAKVKILQIQTNALAQRRVQNAEQKKASADKIAKVGGIPVDSNYIIFIVDTSGSMQKIWSRVIRELENVLTIHPQVKGFQIMNDNGIYLIRGYAGKWIPDTPGRRKSVLSLMKTWTPVSNSSPVEGLQRALKTYAKSTDKLAIYIFGDDYRGASYDLVLNTIAQLNRKTDQSLARIHGIGFGGSQRFSTLMREVARRNRGAFVALGK